MKRDEWSNFTTMISFGLPLIALLYAFGRNAIFHILERIGFCCITNIDSHTNTELCKWNCTDFQMFSVMQPILFAVLLSISAGIFEEIARFIAMRYFMKQTRLAVWFFIWSRAWWY